MSLELKPDAHRRPLWVCHNGRIILEAFSPLVTQAQDFLITIAEPVTRPSRIHEFKLTAYSLYAAVSVGMSTDVILDVLERFSKIAVPNRVIQFIKECTLSYGKVKLVLNRNKYFIESSYPEILRILLASPVIASARVIRNDDDQTDLNNLNPSTLGHINNHSHSIMDGFKKLGSIASNNTKLDPWSAKRLKLVTNGADKEDVDAQFEDDDDDADAIANSATHARDGLTEKGSNLILDDESDFTQSFEIASHMAEEVKKKCTELDYPLMEEYDFRKDDINEDLDIDLSPKTTIRDYQEKCLSKMFGGGASGGRARSGIIVLPTGAGKTLVGITAACTVKKSTLVLCTNALSVEQWANEFRKWSTLQDHQIAKFTADSKQRFAGNSGVVVSTYTMISHTGKRAYDTQKMIEFVNGHEWGLMILDEVHVVPANIFRRVLTTVAAHTKLGLTATLVREDDKIEDLNFLIGPKLYEANWMDLATRGHIAKVEAVEIWCPMTGDFYQQYINSKPGKRRLLCVMNPAKFMAAQYLIKWREKQGDKIIVFSDNVFALEYYAKALKKPYIYGGTSHEERSRILNYFRNNHPMFRTIFLSKVGDTSLDLPEATCLIQISSQFGSRRQEAQRMGRILRAKRRNEEGFKSRFYTLVSKDTDEVVFSARRRTFLVDQGYEFHVVPNYLSMIPEEDRGELLMSQYSDQVKLLQLVKQQTEEVGMDEVVVAEADDLAGVWMSQSGSMGKRGVANRRGRGGSSTNGRPAAVGKKSHSLFKAWKAK
ncbi:hypothetical protein BATDEDRAFT_33160 [Batrachochytrium dendrobatidis JAM81]|uniref:DNA 3'-5' helicase n=1 Tax=Batrachochytrium dendrobatidis (strain JAM81 / FGSC 10211) TaxID=684364 RepID=F4P1G9_BATDJ|nr:uncharacterized protein BATDEDRAFT_33160 [Batrachochytrium dendrobatidis JAM81]EGF80636.1 hypothetical protein BATDEDRAFT_33160 [Batrachochytrium dendrobatidis JAM81]|eukprot:XP_006678554.1 hypothetical protein BATDEDRAFT_33160 [Batrachochytrium dendrobatidis JAM81]